MVQAASIGWVGSGIMGSSMAGHLLRAGHRVAVCEQMEEPDPKRKIIHREVNRIVTPGTITDEGLLDPRAPNHLIAVVPGKGNSFGV
ncbi:MAG: NAD(P)-binding domain-containing protein, partial [Planctomycetota bacterium]